MLVLAILVDCVFAATPLAFSLKLASGGVAEPKKKMKPVGGMAPTERECVLALPFRRVLPEKLYCSWYAWL
jgi:hypothetical protein